MKKIAVAGCKSTTQECMERLVEDGFKIDLIITLTPEMAQREKVAGYMDLSPFAAQQGIPVYLPDTYSLKSDKDKARLQSMELDCLLVVNWQRLIPEWLLKKLSIGAFGMHGSPEPLPRGRGRSPLNWSLLEGKKSFMTHLFKYSAGVDSGDIVGMQKFDINAWDDCHTLHLKNRMSMNRLLKKYLPSILVGTAVFQVQPEGIEPTYFPKRTAADGKIHWDQMDMAGLYNHIRAQTHPFPGAFSYVRNKGTLQKISFWKSHPFDTHLFFYGEPPGKIVETFTDGSFLVSVWDGSLRIYDYSGQLPFTPKVGIRFIESFPEAGE